MISSHEILKKTGIRAAKTLTRWHQAKLIPPPEVRLHPSGRGKMAYWPDWVLERCVRIRQLVAEGYSLKAVANMLGSDWAEEERRAKRQRYRFKDVSAHLDRVACSRNFALLVSEKIEPMLTGLGAWTKRMMHQLDEVLLREQTAKTTIGFVREGYNPVVVFDGDNWLIVPDFVVGHALGRVADKARPYIVMPVFAEVITAFAAIADDLPSAPTITSVSQIRKADGDGLKEFYVHPVGEMDFELSPVDSPSCQHRSAQGR